MAETYEKAAAFATALVDLANALKGVAAREERALVAMRLIHERFPAYAWVGVYWLGPNGLDLGPYYGAPTSHTHIPVGVGVCGTAVATGENQVVDDVTARDNYLSCSLETRSEIVVLLRDENDVVLGQIDADGHRVAAFDRDDEAFLTDVGRLILAKSS